MGTKNKIQRMNAPDPIEKRILRLIDYVDKCPYKITVRQASTIFKLQEATILRIIERLNLEIIGHKNKNERREIERFMKYNPRLTAEQVVKKTGHSSFLVYSVARDKGKRFETKHTTKRRQAA